MFEELPLKKKKSRKTLFTCFSTKVNICGLPKVFEKYLFHVEAITVARFINSKILKPLVILKLSDGKI